MKIETGSKGNETRFTTRSLVAVVRQGLLAVGHSRDVKVSFVPFRRMTVGCEKGEVVSDDAFAAVGLETSGTKITVHGKRIWFYVPKDVEASELKRWAGYAGLRLRGVSKKECWEKFSKWKEDEAFKRGVRPLVVQAAKRGKPAKTTLDRRHERLKKTERALARADDRVRELEKKLARAEGRKKALQWRHRRQQKALEAGLCGSKVTLLEGEG